MIKTKQTFTGKMIVVTIDLCMQKRHHFVGTNLQAVVDSNLQVINTAMNELYKQATASAIRKKYCKLLEQT